MRRRGWAHSVAEREPGVASVSAPVRGPAGGCSPRSRSPGRSSASTRSPGRLHAAAVVAAGEKISDLLRARYRPGVRTRDKGSRVSARIASCLTA